ncbi:XamI family restriction endonuclease [Variovorax rhizosphaerae]|uniref:XamI family restriction endonuclease n=1 Tax=Variovorax rhizosphaerae TaxID=1836200 RepID=A0ABU8WPL8_9BURK
MATLTPAQVALHTNEAQLAKQRYILSRTPVRDASDWHGALRLSRQLIADALRASTFLTDIPAALRASGTHMLVFRHIMAPPTSQDQFALMCPTWRKSTERPPDAGRTRRPMPVLQAQNAAAVFLARRSQSLTPWLDAGRRPFPRELRRLLWSVAPSIANQQFVTLQRGKAAVAQEGAVISMLQRKGWIRRPGSLLDTRAELPLRHFMHKTRYATAAATPQEVDIAMGLRNTVVLAMECKVSNDQTNSVKRVNDILKKATAWKTHWGSFVKTAALLQGVIAPKDVIRLHEAEVEVFWSHDLTAFEAWIDSQT